MVECSYTWLKRGQPRQLDFAVAASGKFSGDDAMKRNENTFAQKTISVIGYVCIIAALILCFLESCDIQPIPESVTSALFAVFFLCAGLNADNRKKRSLGYALAAGWFLLSVMYCF